MAMSSLAKKDKPTMSVTALINWARPAPPGTPLQPTPAAMAPCPSLMQPPALPTSLPNVDCSLDIQCKYYVVKLKSTRESPFSGKSLLSDFRNISHRNGDVVNCDLNLFIVVFFVKDRR